MTYQLTIEPIGETIEIEEGQTILDACLRAGIYVSYQCGHGLCSTCKIDILEGDVDLGNASMFALMDFERDEGKALACCTKPLSDLVIEADIDEDEDAQYLPIQDHHGTVTEITDLSPDVKGIWIELDGDGMAFQAGQYVQLSLPEIGIERPFSLAQAPSDKKLLELHVKLVPGGQGTTYLHNQLKVGGGLDLSGPYGRFFVRKSSPLPMIFFAGGSGLSSPKSMILDLIEAGCDTKMTLFHGARGVQDLYSRELFEDLAAQNENFEYIPALSDMKDGDTWAGETGFIHEAAERRFTEGFKGHKAYLCGPPVMIEACIRTLMKGRLFEKDIYTEKFVTQADGEVGLRSKLFKRI